jgi:uncharacterized membrane protein YsdA (DUF1294 family)/cold shock CspA family protein
MRFDGTIKTWTDERGFGFIEPAQGGQEIFVHIKAFRTRRARPEAGQAVTFEVELNPQGKKRAKAVEPRRPVRHATTPSHAGAAQWGTASYFAIPAFLCVYLVVAVLWRVPGWVPSLYAGASVLAFFIYAADKSAAVAERWRVSESTLLAIGLVGGWPGAIVAQQVLRHKSSKRSFRNVFWGTVALNVAAFVALASPLGQQLMSAGRP